MPALLDVQQQLCDCLVGGAPTGVPSWIRAPAGQAAERLDVYRTTVVGTLVRALRLSFPAVHRIVGSEFFEEAAQVFARQHLPGCGDLNRYGEDFPAFLQALAPCAAVRYLPDVARLDWAAARALHASDAEPVGLQALAGVVAADAARIRFTPHPSLSLLRSDWPVDDIWRAVLRQDPVAMAAIDLADGPVHLVIERMADQVRASRLSPQEWAASSSLMQGVALGPVMERAAADLDVPALLAKHLAAGRFVGFRFATLDGDSP